LPQSTATIANAAAKKRKKTSAQEKAGDAYGRTYNTSNRRSSEPTYKFSINQTVKAPFDGEVFQPNIINITTLLDGTIKYHVRCPDEVGGWDCTERELIDHNPR
jgi:hypothetical protein